MGTSRFGSSATIVTALVLVFAAAAAAQEAEPVPGESEPSAAAASLQPIEGTMVGEHWVDEEAPGCDPGTSWRFQSSGTGLIMGVGAVDFVLTQCTVFDPQTMTGTFGDGTITFTTADGDMLEIAQIGQAGGLIVPDGGFIGATMGGIWEAVDGTGRFAGASGSGWVGGFMDIPGAAWYRLSGEIGYEAEVPTE